MFRRLHRKRKEILDQGKRLYNEMAVMFVMESKVAVMVHPRENSRTTGAGRFGRLT